MLDMHGKDYLTKATHLKSIHTKNTSPNTHLRSYQIAFKIILDEPWQLPRGLFQKKMGFLIKQCLDHKQQNNLIIVGQQRRSHLAPQLLMPCHCSLDTASLHLDSFSGC